MSIEAANRIARNVLDSAGEERKEQLSVLGDALTDRGDATIAEITRLLSQMKEQKTDLHHPIEWKDKIINLLDKKTDEWKPVLAHLSIQKLANELRFPDVEFSEDMRSAIIDYEKGIPLVDVFDIVTKTTVRNLKMLLQPNLEFPDFATANETTQQYSDLHLSEYCHINKAFSNQKLHEAGVTEEDPVKLTFTGGVFMQMTGENIDDSERYSRHALDHIGIDNPLLSAQFHIDTLRIARINAGALLERMESPYISVEKVEKYKDAYVFTNITELAESDIPPDAEAAMYINKFCGSENELWGFYHNARVNGNTRIKIDNML